MSGPGRHDKNYRQFAWDGAIGNDAGASVTSVAYTKEGQGLSFVTWNPPIPRACKLTGGAITNICSSITVAGDWTLSFFLNEAFPTADATATFPCTTALQGTPLDWSGDVLCQAGDRWWILATGPERNTVITRVTLEFELL